jgi:TusA-related sulfurtransferase
MDSTQKLQVDHSLDVRGMPRATGFLKSREQLQGMLENQVLELHIDEGEPLTTIPFALRADGHEILVSEPAQHGVRLLVRKRSLVT